ncbi:MAG: antibiotic biosynthesis monooxygenase [Dehalococcoidia bacterium]
MFSQLVRVKVQPGKVDEAIAIFNDVVIPAARQQKGFRNAYLLVDRSANRGVGFSLWETEADVEALATSGFYQEQVAKFAAVFDGPPEREVYEVGAGA